MRARRETRSARVPPSGRVTSAPIMWQAVMLPAWAADPVACRTSSGKASVEMLVPSADTPLPVHQYM